MLRAKLTFARALIICVGMAAWAAGAGADETLYCRHYITALPATITQPGHYCFFRNLSTPMTSGIAITIAADFVWLDLNNFALDGSAAGMGTLAKGIFSENHKYVTVRNGIVRGFIAGIELEGNYLTVEDIRADRNTRSAISIVSAAAGNVARRNRITNTGGTTFLNLTGITGLAIVGTWSVIYGITFSGAPGVAYKAVAVNNRVTTSTDVGISCNSNPGLEVVLRDNIVVDAPTPYFGCTPIGTTNYP
jgi:hypothetical protein